MVKGLKILGVIVPCLVGSVLVFEPTLFDYDNHRHHAKRVASYRVYSSVEAIPMSVRSAFTADHQIEKFHMANPSAEWQSTDVVAQIGLPSFRLREVALSDSLCILVYEHGGIARGYSVEVFRLADNKATLGWKSDFTAPDRLPEIEAALERGTIVVP